MRTLAFLLIAATAAPLPAQRPAETTAAREVARAFEEARLHGDRAALERLLAPDFLFVRASGRIGDRRDFIAGFTDAASRLTAFEVEDRLLLRIAANVVIAGGEATAQERAPDGTAQQHFRFSDTLVLKDGRWMVSFEQITPLPRRRAPGARAADGVYRIASSRLGIGTKANATELSATP